MEIEEIIAELNNIATELEKAQEEKPKDLAQMIEEIDKAIIRAQEEEKGGRINGKKT